MSKKRVLQGNEGVHPERPGAVGSRNSIFRDDRNEYGESRLVIDEEVDKLLNHVQSKLPPEVLEKLDVMGGIKSKLHTYYNQNLQNMLNRYLVTAEDELAKKYRDMLDREEASQVNRYTPRGVTELLSKLGEEEHFSTSEFEKSVANIYGHMQGHVQRAFHNLEHETNSLLRQKHDVGSFVRQENAYAIVKCSFKNNPFKPKTVFDVKLAINILDTELLTPIYHYQKEIQELLKEIISDHLHKKIDEEVDAIANEHLSRGVEALNENELIFEKFKSLENKFNFEEGNSKESTSKHDELIAKRLLDRLEPIGANGEDENADLFDIRESVRYLLEREQTLNAGFNRVVNSLTTILDNSKMGYQYIDNRKNSRICVIREYAATLKEELPDETFGIRLSYFDQKQLHEMRSTYDLQAQEMERQVSLTETIVEKLHRDYRESNGIKSYQEISEEFESLGRGKENSGVSEKGGLWEDLIFVAPEKADTPFRTNINFNALMKRRLSVLTKRIGEIFGKQHPQVRLVLEERLELLEAHFQNFASRINPHHLQQGLTLDVDITSVKRKRTTMNAMSNVLNEFLYKVSKGFTDKSIGPLTHRRSILAENPGKTTLDTALQQMDQQLEGIEI